MYMYTYIYLAESRLITYAHPITRCRAGGGVGGGGGLVCPPTVSNTKHAPLPHLSRRRGTSKKKRPFF